MGARCNVLVGIGSCTLLSVSIFCQSKFIKILLTGNVRSFTVPNHCCNLPLGHGRKEIHKAESISEGNKSESIL